MQLKFNLKGSVEPLLKYLENFYKIDPTIVLEIDTQNQAFVAKLATHGHSCLRYSSITFAECNITVAEHDTAPEFAGRRIVFSAAKECFTKLISTLKRFKEETDDSKAPNFDITLDYDRLDLADGEFIPVCTDVCFRSDALTMRLQGCVFDETSTNSISDKKFFEGVFRVDEPVTFALSAAVIESIINTSDIVKTSEKKKDSLMFYVDNDMLMVRDYVQNSGMSKPANFEFKLGQVNTTGYPINATVNREKFIAMLGKSNEDFKIIIGKRQNQVTGEYVIDRILFDSLTTNTKIAISIINEY